MARKPYMLTGDCVLDYDVPTGVTVESGDIVVCGDLLGVATVKGTEGQEIAVALEGRWKDVKKKTGEAWAQGAKLYFDAGTKEATTSSASGANKFLGYAAKKALSGDVLGEVYLRGVGA